MPLFYIPFPWHFYRVDGVTSRLESGVPVISRVGRMHTLLERLVCSMLRLGGMD